ncbi:MAG: S8 family serine peptidase [Archangium sp.]|nr:S8 family serine peptidase [Archangium sp.]
MLASVVTSLFLAAAPEDLWEANHPEWRVVGASRTSLPYLGREISFLWTEPEAQRMIAVDEAGLEVNWRAAFSAEKNLRREEKGAASEELWVYLRDKPDSTVVTVGIWAVAPTRTFERRDESSLREDVAKQASLDLAQLQLVLAAYGLEGQAATYAPSVVVAATKDTLLRGLAHEPAVDWIELAESEKVLFGVDADSVKFDGAYALGRRGTGQSIATVEPGKIHLSSVSPARWWNVPISSNLPGGSNATFHPARSDVRGQFSRISNDEHATRVAAVASYYFDGTRYSGAYESRLFSANPASESDFDFVGAYSWSLSTAAARIVNHSYGFRRDPRVESSSGQLFAVPPSRPYYLDQIVDSYSRNAATTHVQAVGNDKAPVVGWLGYNSIKVGGFDHVSTTSWADDRWWEDPFEPTRGSSYRNPPLSVTVVGGNLVTVVSDRELPEIVAVSVNRVSPKTTFPLPAGPDSNDLGETGTGTSFAAPQVAAVAALVMEEAPYLRIWPEAVKAILMASATNPVFRTNGSGAGSIPDFGEIRGVGVQYMDDRKTGAGGLSAAAAVSVARGSSGRVRYGMFSPAQPYGSVRESFILPTCRQRMRMVLAWSVSYGCNFCSTDADDVENEPTNRASLLNANIIAYDSSGRRLGISRSIHNNYEIIDVPTPSGQFVRLDVYGAAAGMRPEYYGLAMHCYSVDGQGIPNSD